MGLAHMTNRRVAGLPPTWVVNHAFLPRQFPAPPSSPSQGVSIWRRSPASSWGVDSDGTAISWNTTPIARRLRALRFVPKGKKQVSPGYHSLEESGQRLEKKDE